MVHDLAVVYDRRGGDHVDIVSQVRKLKDGALVGGHVGRYGGHREANGHVLDVC